MGTEPAATLSAEQREVRDAFRREGLGHLLPAAACTLCTVVMLSLAVLAADDGIGWTVLVLVSAVPLGLLAAAFDRALVTNVFRGSQTVQAMGDGPEAILRVRVSHGGEGGTTRVAVDLSDGRREWLYADGRPGTRYHRTRLVALLEPHLRPDPGDALAGADGPSRAARMLDAMTGRSI